MHEIVIVLSDLYSPPAPGGAGAEGIALPGLEQVTRFGTRSVLAKGWRSWLAHWAGRPSNVAPATVAAAVIRDPAAGEAGAAAATPLPGGATLAVAPASAEAAARMVWLATPVHLLAGLTTLHLDRRSILRLPQPQLRELAEGFRVLFADSDFSLQPLQSGDFLLFGPAMTATDAGEPARYVGESIADSLHARTGATQLRRLGAELEMWLHDHPVNRARASRAELAISALWLWGGGPVPAVSHPDNASSADIAFGNDAFLQGLRSQMSAGVHAMPQQLTDIFSYPHARRAVLVTEIGEMLHSNPGWTLFDALARIDSQLILPAARALRRGELQRLTLIANDRHWLLRSGDRFKFWKRRRRGLEGLQ